MPAICVDKRVREQLDNRLRTDNWKYYRTSQAEVWPQESTGEISSFSIDGDVLTIRMDRYGDHDPRNSVIREFRPETVQLDLNRCYYVTFRDDGDIVLEDGYNIFELVRAEGELERDGGLDKYVVNLGEEEPPGFSDFPGYDQI
jgi:hypothetical protein